MTTALFNTKSYTSNIESAYIQMYERYQSDLVPDHIHVSD
jgi:predicted O-linked N-acetylglucosamine transferase (SPINDLY family)